MANKKYETVGVALNKAAGSECAKAQNPGFQSSRLSVRTKTAKY
jgi:hypothetical protein